MNTHLHKQTRLCYFPLSQLSNRLYLIWWYAVLGIATEYKSITPAQFQNRLVDGGMSPVMALDYTEQLQIFEECGQIYDDPNLIQASEVRLV
jgi:hypothetical protein